MTIFLLKRRAKSITNFHTLYFQTLKSGLYVQIGIINILMNVQTFSNIRYHGLKINSY